MAAYLTERAEAGLCNGTLDGDCAAIAHRHHQEGLANPTAAAVVRRVRRGLRRILGTAPRRQAHPLNVAELAQIVASIDAASRIGVRDRAILLLGYAAALRPSEIAALDLADAGVDPHGLLITIRRSKTDQEGFGQIVGVAAGRHAATDPVRATPRSPRPAAAARSRVWEVISDFDKWSEWNPSVPSISGDLKVGSTCTVKLVMPGRPSVNVKVTLTDLDPGRRFAWHGNIAHDRFFAGDRSLVIEPETDGTVLVTHTEEITGAFFPVFKTLMGKEAIQAHHDNLNAGLTQRAEH